MKPAFWILSAAVLLAVLAWGGSDAPTADDELQRLRDQGCL